MGSERVDKFRKLLGAPFSIRGNARRTLFSTRKPLTLHNDHEIPVYHIDPSYAMSSEAWVRRLHSTIHAAVARAINDGVITWGNLKKTKANQLPALSVFGPALEGTRLKRKIEYYRRLLRGAKTTFRPRRAQYEQASVHGKVMPTFQEGYLAGPILNEKFHFNQDKIFDVILTKDEFKRIVSKMEARLKKIGSSIGEVNSLESSEYERALELVAKAYGTKTPFTQETTPDSALDYAFYIEAAKVLTNKLVKKGISWVNKNLPEK